MKTTVMLSAILVAGAINPEILPGLKFWLATWFLFAAAFDVMQERNKESYREELQTSLRGIYIAARKQEDRL